MSAAATATLRAAGAHPRRGAGWDGACSVWLPLVQDSGLNLGWFSAVGALRNAPRSRLCAAWWRHAAPGRRSGRRRRLGAGWPASDPPEAACCGLRRAAHAGSRRVGARCGLMPPRCARQAAAPPPARSPAVLAVAPHASDSAALLLASLLTLFAPSVRRRRGSEAACAPRRAGCGARRRRRRGSPCQASRRVRVSAGAPQRGRPPTHRARPHAPCLQLAAQQRSRSAAQRSRSRGGEGFLGSHAALRPRRSPFSWLTRRA